MIQIDLLYHHQDKLEQLAEIWYEGLGRIWLPEITRAQAVERFRDHANTDCLPITFVALHEKQIVGMCSLRDNDGIRPDLKPWLGSLGVHKQFRGQAIASRLMDAIKEQARKMGFEDLYLFAFDRTIPEYYQTHGWSIIADDVYKTHPVTVMHMVLSVNNSKHESTCSPK